MATIADVKAQVSPSAFYLAELPGFKNTNRIGPWRDGDLCPFHNDRKAGSFRVNTETGGFICYACDAHGGDVLAFICLRDHLPVRVGLEYFAERGWL